MTISDKSRFTGAVDKEAVGSISYAYLKVGIRSGLLPDCMAEDIQSALFLI